MSKVFLGVGHGGKDPGAVGYLREADVNLNMALACKDYLVANGVEVQMSRTKDENDDLNEEIRECNAYNPDLAVDIHNNAGGGDGFEVYHTIYGGTGETLARNIEAEILAIGQNSRGVKTRKGQNGDYYGFIRLIKCPSIIVEGVFVDNAADAAQADTLEEQKAFGVAYAKGILKTLGITPTDIPVTPEPAPAPAPEPTTGYLVKITCDVLNVRKGPGTNYGIATKVKRNEVYTIVGENGNWGQLKSGAGWICLDYTEKVTSGSAPTVPVKTLEVGSKVKIKSSASKYCTGETIPSSIKGKVYTVMQIGSSRFPNGILLKEIMSWVNKSDIEIQ